MTNNYNIWRKVYPQLPLEVDPVKKAKLKKQIKEINRDMCKDLNNIMNYLEKAGIDIRYKYKQIEYICTQRITL